VQSKASSLKYPAQTLHNDPASFSGLIPFRTQAQARSLRPVLLPE
jgi:hypothetical protein